MSLAQKFYDALNELKTLKADILYVDEQIAASGSSYVHPATHSADIIVDGSTNKAYTATEKTKLAGIADSANNYSHPATHSADVIVDGSTNKAYTSTEKTKLAGIASGATAYSHPATHSADIIVDGSTNKAYTATEKTKLAGIGSGIGAHIMCHNNARAQSIVSGTNTIVQVDRIISNNNGAVFSQNGYGIQCLIEGLYTIDVMVAFTTTGTTGRTGVSIFKNAVQYDLGFIPMRDNYDKAVGSMTLPLAANDIIYFGAFQNSGSNKTLAIGGYVSENRMSISKVA